MSEAEPQSFFRFSMSSLTQVLIVTQSLAFSIIAFSSSVTPIPSLNHVTLATGFALKGTFDACCMLSLHSNAVCNKKLEDRFFNNRRIWKEQKTSESCSCKYSLTSFLCLQVPRKGDPKLGPSHTPSCF